MDKALKKFSPTDIITIAYLAIVAVFVLLLSADSQFTWLVLLTHLVFIGAISILAINLNKNSRQFFRFFRQWYPVVLFTFMYFEVGMVNRLLFPEFFDPFLIKLERFIFDCEPAMILPVTWKSQWLVEFTHLSYFLYYAYLPVIGLILYFSRRELFVRFIFTVALTFYLCYLAFMLFPATGPIPLRVGMYSGCIVSLMEIVYKLDLPGQAFPSSHVAIGFVVLFFSLRHSRLLGFIMLPLVVSLTIATVYCRYHYAVDAFAGIITAAAITAAADWVILRFPSRFRGLAEDSVN